MGHAPGGSGRAATVQVWEKREIVWVLITASACTGNSSSLGVMLCVSLTVW